VQEGNASFAPKFVREDGRIDWNQPSETIRRRIRAVTREPGAFTTIGDDTLGILSAGEGDGRQLAPGQVDFSARRVLVGTADTTIELLVVQPAGKPAMSASDWLRGRRTSVTFS
jgi:methionyl-tRNA formyltransferase